MLLAFLVMEGGAVEAQAASATTSGQVVREFAAPVKVKRTWGDAGAILEEVKTLLEELAGEEQVRLLEFPLPTPSGWSFVDLELKRIRVLAPDAVLLVDGVPRDPAELLAGTSHWLGRVVGDEHSDVMLSLTPTGSRGWIHSDAGKARLVSWRIAERDTYESKTAIVRGEDLRLMRSPKSFTCEVLAPETAQGGARITGPVRDQPAPDAQAAGSCDPTLRCRLAVATDYQYHTLFGDVGASAQYTTSLLASVSTRFEGYAHTELVLAYLELYSTDQDPWATPDEPGSATGLLYEFKGAWDDAPLPGSSHLAHFLSGAALGGGVAYLNGLCNPNTQYAVSGDLSGQTALPVVGPNFSNWDFVVVSHEIGHNFGARHTHDYCPPIDECAPPAYWGGCQDEQICPTGTIMSYCHLCPGGINNIVPQFHTRTSNDMKASALASCIDTVNGSFVGGPVFYDDNYSGGYDAGEGLIPGATIRLTGPRGTFETVADSAGNYSFAGLVCGSYTLRILTPNPALHLKPVQSFEIAVGPASFYQPLWILPPMPQIEVPCVKAL